MKSSWLFQSFYSNFLFIFSIVTKMYAILRKMRSNNMKNWKLKKNRIDSLNFCNIYRPQLCRNDIHARVSHYTNTPRENICTNFLVCVKKETSSSSPCRQLSGFSSSCSTDWCWTPWSDRASHVRLPTSWWRDWLCRMLWSVLLCFGCLSTTSSTSRWWRSVC